MIKLEFGSGILWKGARLYERQFARHRFRSKCVPCQEYSHAPGRIITGDSSAGMSKPAAEVLIYQAAGFPAAFLL